MSDLSIFGKLIRTYKGFGELYFDNSNRKACNFTTIQVVNGRIYAECMIDEYDSESLNRNKALSLRGVTNDGRQISLEVQVLVGNCISTNKDQVLQETIVMGREATIIYEEDGGQPPFTFRFVLSNLTFVGTQQLEVDDYKFIIRHNENYSRIVNELRRTKGVDITCTATVIVETLEREEEVVSVADDLCTLMTLCRGCRIDWLYYDVKPLNGEIVKSVHKNAITKPFGNILLIPELPPHDMKDFIETTYPAFIKQKKLWGLLKAINAYNDSKAEGDFLEARGLKAVVVTEHLKDRFLSTICQPPKTTILDPAIFNTQVDKIIEANLVLLNELFPSTEKKPLKLMAHHVKGLNWYPFNRAISDICNSLGLSINSIERRRFTEIRNELVHRLQFHDDEERFGDRWEQYTFLLSFIGKILLAILGYQGHYYDCSNHGRVMESEARTKLDLAK